MTTNPYHPKQITATDTAFGRRIHLSWAQDVELGDVRFGPAGELHLAISLTDKSGPEYGSVTLDSEDRILHASSWPAGVYLPALFLGPGRKLFVLGNVEENEKEREVLFPATDAHLPPSRPRLAANLVEILGVSNGSVVRFLADFMQKAAPKLVVDPLLSGGKRVAVKLPQAPYPAAALLDGDGRVHVITRGATQGRDTVLDLLGKPVGAHDFDLNGIGGLGGLRPVTLAVDGSGVYVTGHEHGLGLIHVDANGHSEYEECVKLPIPDAKVYMVLATRSAESSSVTHFTWGSDSTNTTGAGWITVRNGRASRSWVSDAGGYRDERGKVHEMGTGKTTLRGLDVMADGTAIGVFSSEDAATDLWLARVSA